MATVTDVRIYRRDQSPGWAWAATVGAEQKTGTLAGSIDAPHEALIAQLPSDVRAGAEREGVRWGTNPFRSIEPDARD